MKHIKLFEQFEDDPFGEETRPNEYENKYRIFKSENGKFYLAEKVDLKRGIVQAYMGFPKEMYIKRYNINLNPILKKDTIIRWYHFGLEEWHEMIYSELPERIKIKLMDDQRNII